MRASFWAVSASAVVVLVSAWAENKTPPALQPGSLARYEAITSYCERTDPGAAAQYISKLALVSSTISSDELSADRNSAQYREAMAQANDTLSKASPSTGIRGCTEFLAEK